MKYAASPEILESDDLAQVAWNAIEPIWDDLPIRRFKALAEFMEGLTEGQRRLIALDWCQKEIRNGGFAQLFENPTGNLVPWAVEGFRMIGAHKYSTIVESVVSMLGPTYPTSSAARKRAYGALSQSQRREIEKAEDAFYVLLSSPIDDLEEYRGGYVKRHPEQFIESSQDG